MIGKKTTLPSMNDDLRYSDAVGVMLELEQAGYKARLAGGCVRDRLLGRIPNDYDIVTDATPEKVIQALKSFHHKVIPTGIAHGTVTALTRSCPIEITTLRRDVEHSGRRAKVSFGVDFEEDAKRRDFTVNALFEDKNGTIYDYVDGQIDLKKGVLRFVGDPSQRISEDALRILRLFRFWSRLGFEPVPGTIEAIVPHVLGLKKMSQERVTSELWQLFSGAYFNRTLSALHSSLTLSTIDETLGIGLKIYLKKANEQTYPIESIAVHHRSLAFTSLFLLLSQSTALDYLAWGSSFKLRTSDKKTLHLVAQLLAEFPPLQASRGQKLFFLTRCQIKELNFKNFFAPLWATYLLFAEGIHQEAFKHFFELKKLSEIHESLLYEKKMPLNGKDIEQHLSKVSGIMMGELLQLAKISWLDGVWETQEEGLRWLESHFKLRLE